MYTYYRIIKCALAETRLTAVADEPVKESLTMRAAGTISAILVLIAVALGLTTSTLGYRPVDLLVFRPVALGVVVLTFVCWRRCRPIC